jgi:hypothetical protein
VISNAKNIKIGSYGRLPNMSNTIIGWFQDITFGVVTRGSLDFDDTEVVNTVKTKGVVQPYKPTELEIEEAGTRSWGWLMVHCLPDLVLYNNQFVYYEGVKYKVMNLLPYDKYGFRQYTLCEAYNE